MIITRACYVTGPRRPRSKIVVSRSRHCGVSTFARLVLRTLDPARGYPIACVPLFSSPLSTGNVGHDLRCRPVTTGISSPGGACEPLVSTAWAPQVLDRVCATFCVNASDLRTRVDHRVRVGTL